MVPPHAKPKSLKENIKRRTYCQKCVNCVSSPRAPILCRGLEVLMKTIRMNRTINEHGEINAYQKDAQQWWAVHPAHLWWVTLLCHVDYILRVRKDRIPNSCNTRGGRGGRSGGRIVCSGWDVVWKLPKEGYFTLAFKIIQINKQSDQRAMS